ncbi:caspase family protein [Aurantivibrio infirmus]
MKFLSTLLLATSSVAFCNLGFTEDRVLLVGVGDYQYGDNDLPGINYDIDAMVNVSKLMGFKDNQIKILRDTEATEKNVANAMLTWLVDGVKADDRVLFYFSGHGSRFKDSSGDETDDKKDETILTSDFRIVNENGKRYVAGAIVDDTLGKILEKIPSKHVMVFIDACNSGTATRSLDADPSLLGVSKTYSKYLHHGFDDVAADPDIEAATSSQRAIGVKAAVLDGSSDNYVALTAAKDDEKALATSKGSLFTLGLKQTVRNAVNSNANITPAQIQKAVQNYINSRTSPAKIFHPQLSGNPNKFNSNLPLASISNGAANVAGTNWSNLVELSNKISSQQDGIKITTNAQQYKLGESIVISVDVPGNGYLNVITVDSKDGDTILFPNQFHKDNRVSAGMMTIPTDKMKFTLPATEPAGDALVVVVFSEDPINLYNEQVGGKRKANGEYDEVFAQISEPGMRAIGVAAKKSNVMRSSYLKVNTVK